MSRIREFFLVEGGKYVVCPGLEHISMPSDWDGFYTETIILNYTNKPIFMMGADGIERQLQQSRNLQPYENDKHNIEIYTRIRDKEPPKHPNSHDYWDRGPYDSRVIKIDLGALITGPVAVFEIGTIFYFENHRGRFVNPFNMESLEDFGGYCYAEGRETRVADRYTIPLTVQFTGSKTHNIDSLNCWVGGIDWKVQRKNANFAVRKDGRLRITTMRKETIDSDRYVQTVATEEQIKDFVEGKVIDVGGVLICRTRAVLTNDDRVTNRDRLAEMTASHDQLKVDIDEQKKFFTEELKRKDTTINTMKSREETRAIEEEEELRKIKHENERMKLENEKMKLEIEKKSKKAENLLLALKIAGGVSTAIGAIFGLYYKLKNSK